MTIHLRVDQVTPAALVALRDVRSKPEGITAKDVAKRHGWTTQKATAALRLLVKERFTTAAGSPAVYKITQRGAQWLTHTP